MKLIIQRQAGVWEAMKSPIIELQSVQVRFKFYGFAEGVSQCLIASSL